MTNVSCFGGFDVSKSVTFVGLVKEAKNRIGGIQIRKGTYKVLKRNEIFKVRGKIDNKKKIISYQWKR